jgi:hypothetical protein
MATGKESFNNNPDRLRAENEEKKKKLIEEHGAYFSSLSNDTNLPPEIESQFLNNIMAFEDAYQNNKRIRLFDYLGKPTTNRIEDLMENEIPDELNRLIELLSRHQVILDTLCDVDDRELYRFITEELFFEEIDDMHIPGMITHYTYEEFHPNHAYDIERLSTDFIHSYLNKESDFYTYSLSTEAGNTDWHIQFREAFSSFQLNDFSIQKFDFDTEKAVVQFDCDFVGQVEGAVESLRFLGKGELILLYQWDFWCVDSIKLPNNQKI